MKRKLILIITFAAFFLFGATLVRALWYAPDSDVEVPAPNARSQIDSVAQSDQPARLHIPSIDVDADIQYVGLGATGNMAVPTNYSDVGWYRFGTVPGRSGSAVMDGHVDNGLGFSGVFKNLSKLREGESVYVETKGGKRLRFVITDVETYGYKEVPSDLVFNRADTKRLNLITCGGSWLKSEETYDERIVVYTVLVP